MADALKAQGNAAFSAQNYEDAVKYFSQAIDIDGSNHVLYSNRSAAYASLHQYSNALKDAKKCVEVKPDWAKGYSRLGAAYYGLEEWEDAIKAYEDGLRIDPSNAQLQAALNDVMSAKNRPPAGGIFGPEAMMRLALDPRTRDLMDDAEFKKMMAGLNQNPGMLQMYMQDKRMQLALEVMLGVKMGTKEDFMNGAAAEAAAAAGVETMAEASSAPRRESATAAAAAASSSKPTPAAAAEAPEVEMTDGEKGDAEAKKKAQEAKQRGNELYKAKKFDEAIAAYDQALELYDKDISFLTNRAAVHFEKGDYEASIKDCEKAVEDGRAMRAEYTLVAKALARKGNALVKQDRLEEAIEAYNKSLMEHRVADTLKRLNETEKQLKEKTEQAYINMDISAEEKEKGNEAFKANKYPEAVAHYTEALKRGPPSVNPEAHKIYSNLAACYTKLGAYPEGVKAADKCIELAPEFPKGYSRKGTLQFFMKEYDKAMATYETGLKHDPDNQELKDGFMRCLEQMDKVAHGDESEEDLALRRDKAMADPEIQSILTDPVMRQVLSELQENPAAARKHLLHPDINKKISKLVAAGIIQMR